jgi:hypothetical protein
MYGIHALCTAVFVTFVALAWPGVSIGGHATCSESWRCLVFDPMCRGPNSWRVLVWAYTHMVMLALSSGPVSDATQGGCCHKHQLPFKSLSS